MKPVRFAKGLQPLLVPIDQVQQHPDNPNNGDDENLIESIKVNGFVTAITADARTGYITAGNTRYRALHALGATEIPVVWVDHWDKEGATRYLIGDNASARRAVMDQDAQLELLKWISETETGLIGTGIDNAEYERMLLEQATSHEAPDGQGFGHGAAVLGLHQIVIQFDNEEERDNVYADLATRYDNVRTADL